MPTSTIHRCVRKIILEINPIFTTDDTNKKTEEETTNNTENNNSNEGSNP